MSTADLRSRNVLDEGGTMLREEFDLIGEVSIDVNISSARASHVSGGAPCEILPPRRLLLIFSNYTSSVRAHLHS